MSLAIINEIERVETNCSDYNVSTLRLLSLARKKKGMRILTPKSGAENDSSIINLNSQY